jgi:hypothetical protein
VNYKKVPPWIFRQPTIADLARRMRTEKLNHFLTARFIRQSQPDCRHLKFTLN